MKLLKFVFWTFVILVVPGGILAFIVWNKFKRAAPSSPSNPTPKNPEARS